MAKKLPKMKMPMKREEFEMSDESEMEPEMSPEETDMSEEEMGMEEEMPSSDMEKFSDEELMAEIKKRGLESQLTESEDMEMEEPSEDESEEPMY